MAQSEATGKARGHAPSDGWRGVAGEPSARARPATNAARNGHDADAAAIADSAAEAIADSAAEAVAAVTAAVADSVAGAVAGADSDSVAGAVADAVADSVADAVADAEADSDAGSEAVADAVADSVAGAVADAEAVADADSVADAVADSVAGAVADGWRSRKQAYSARGSCQGSGPEAAPESRLRAPVGRPRCQVVARVRRCAAWLPLSSSWSDAAHAPRGRVAPPFALPPRPRSLRPPRRWRVHGYSVRSVRRR